jgi:hypothetical protein
MRNWSISRQSVMRSIIFNALWSLLGKRRLALLLHRKGSCPLLAQSGHRDTLNQCLLLGVKRTSQECAAMSASDPKADISRLELLLCNPAPKPHFAVRKSLL